MTKTSYDCLCVCAFPCEIAEMYHSAALSSEHQQHDETPAAAAAAAAVHIHLQQIANKVKGEIIQINQCINRT